MVFFPPYISAISTGTKPVDIQRLMRKTKASYTSVKRKARQRPMTPNRQAPRRLRFTSFLSLSSSFTNIRA